MKSFLLAITSALLALAIAGPAQSASVAVHATEVTSDQTMAGTPRGTALRDLLVIGKLTRPQAQVLLASGLL